MGAGSGEEGENGSMNGKVCLIVLFNHRYDKNIERLEEMYRNRFSSRFYLMPFYDGNRENVIPVYENSHQFQGYLAQGFSRFYDESYEHYFIVADDMIINPEINEENYQEYFKLGEGTGYITDLYPLSEWSGGFERLENAMLVRAVHKGVNCLEELPDPEKAFACAKEKGFGSFRFPKKMVFNSTFSYNYRYWSSRSRIHLLARVLLGITDRLDYPYMCAYSDIFIVSGSAVREFCRICGVFAAARLHVETALPTALMLAEKRILTNADLGYRADLLWDRSRREQIGERNHWSIARLTEKWEKDMVCMHPIKLSQWKS